MGHVFKMHLPLFVPEKRLLRNMVHLGNQRLMPYPYNTPSPFSQRKQIEALHPYDPFQDTIRWPHDATGVASRGYWAEYSEYILLPALQRFESSADLIHRLHISDGLKISLRMRNEYVLDLAEMRAFWTVMLTSLLES